LRFTKISGTFLKFDDGKRLDTGAAYASQDLRLDEHEIVVKTFGHGKQIETRFVLQGPGFLDFVATSDDSKIPVMTGHFFNSDYDECVVTAVLPDQKLSVSGVLTKLDQVHALSTKTLTDTTSGKIVGIVLERAELITEDAFNAAIGKG
jgi:hypothetical protein